MDIPPFMPAEALDQLARVYQRLYQDITGIKQQTGLSCPLGCGRCCLRPSAEVEATMLEMLPLAWRLFQEKQAWEVHARAREAGAGNRCVLYSHEEGDPAQGSCTRYAERPLVCRLFGFSGNRDKLGRFRMQFSRTMLEASPGLEAVVRAREADLINPPVNAAYGQEVHQLLPGLSDRLLPLNEAIALAIEWVGLRLRWWDPQDPDLDRTPPQAA